MIDPDSSSTISGVIRDLRGELPEGAPEITKVPGIHPVYVVDPWVVRKEFHQGFQIGVNWEKAKRDVDEREADDYIEAKLGKLVLLGSDSGKKILASYIESPRVVADRQAFYAILGSNGLRGFNRRQHKTPPAPVAVLAHFAQPVRGKELQDDIIDAFDTSLIVHHAKDITLGPEKRSFND
jgi:hypothetical protein